MNKLSTGQWIGIGGAVVASGIARNGMPTLYPGDFVAFGLLGLLLFWFLRPRRLRADGPENAELTRKSVAFRLGQSLNRIRRGARR